MSTKPSGPSSLSLKPDSNLRLSAGGSSERESCWSEMKNTETGSDHGDSDSELSEAENFLAKGAFLLTPSYELSMEKASTICEKMNFKGAFSLTKTATGILFKFSHPDDYQAVFKKGFHKVTGARFYKKIPIPCRPQKTFTIFVLEIPEDIPEEDIRHSLYKFNSVVEVTRLVTQENIKNNTTSKTDSGIVATKSEKPPLPGQPAESQQPTGPPPIVRITLASMEEANMLLQNGLDFYGATFFPTETITQTQVPKDTCKKMGSRSGRFDLAAGSIRVKDLLPVFDASGFQKIAPPENKTIVPTSLEFGKK